MFRGARLDLTQSHLYTLSQGTKNILAGIDEPIHLYLFFSDKGTQDLPQLRTYAQRVREMLEEMAARVRRQDQARRDRSAAVLRGRRSRHRLRPAGRAERRRRGENIFLGLAGTNSTNGKSVIPFLQPDKEAFLEYDVAKLIHELSVTKKTGRRPDLRPADEQRVRSADAPDARTVGGRQQQLQQLVRRAPAERDVAEVDRQGHQRARAGAPEGLSDDAQYAIDQFVMRGGHLLVFVDPNAETDESGADPNNPQAAMFADKSSDLPKLFKAWGVQYDPHKVVLDRAHALQISIAQGAPPVRDAAILGFAKRDLNPDDVTTANLDSINISSRRILPAGEGFQEQARAA